MTGKKILEYTPHTDQNGCVGFTHNFIPHKSTKFGNFLDFKLLYIVLIESSILVISTSESNKW